MKRAWPLVLVALLSVVTRFAWYGDPREVVLDEVLVGKFVSAYFTHSVVFDSHPALAKLLVAGFAALCGWRPGFTFDHIGQVYPGTQHLVLRFLPTLAGALLPIVVWLLARELRFGRLAATTAALSVVFENALLTDSRFLLPDSFLLVFGFAGLYFSLRSARTGGWASLVAAAACFGAAASVKWTGLSFLALGLAAVVVAAGGARAATGSPAVAPGGAAALPDAQRRWSLLRRAGRLAAIIAVAVALYTAVMTVHVSLTVARVRTPILGPTSLTALLVATNRDIFNANRNLTATHPYGSAWYTWPLMLRPLYCWNDAMTPPARGPAAPTLARIYLLGNPLVWWGSSIAVLVLLVGLALRWFKGEFAAYFLAGGYLVNLLPFAGIGRVMFLYHYFPALVFAILALAYLLDRTPAPRRSHAAVLAAAFLAFLFFAPLSYGLPLSPPAYRARVWLATWQ